MKQIDMKMQRDSLRALQKATRIGLIAGACVLVVLAGCGKKESGASQTAAKVNKEEITVHQINFALQQQRGLAPDQAEAASHQILERLIDQELAVQKAGDLKLDRDPQVVAQMEAAKREVLASAYVRKVAESAPKPTADEVRKYYDAKPLLFKDRHVYSVQELAIEASPDQVAALRTKLQGTKNISEFVDYLRANNIKFNASQAVRPAEQVPLASLDILGRMSEGQAVLSPSSTGAQVLVLVGARSQPVDFDHARPAVEQYLLNESKRELVNKNLKDLRADAKIQYVGKFAEGIPAAAPAASEPSAQSAATPAESPPASAAVLDVPAASGAMDPSTINKGLGK